MGPKIHMEGPMSYILNSLKGVLQGDTMGDYYRVIKRETPMTRWSFSVAFQQ